MLQSTLSATPLTTTLLRSAASHWPAVAKWSSLDYLSSAVPPHTHVRAELGGPYTSPDCTELRLPFADIIGYLRLAADRGSPPPTSEQCYVAQDPDLLNDSPQLLADIDDSQLREAIGVSIDDPIDRRLWIGPMGTFTPLHRDPLCNVFVQIVGEKTVWTADADRDLPRVSGRQSANTTSLDPRESPDVTRHEMAAGDILVLPKKEWHAMESRSPVSVSLSVWWEGVVLSALWMAGGPSQTTSYSHP